MDSLKSLSMEAFYPDKPWSKFLFKAPLISWRLGLGPISGKLMLLITATGRKSGLPRRFMVEYRRLNGKKYIVSGFGNKAQWYKNIAANPNITVQSSDGTESLKAVRVTDDAELLAVYDIFRANENYGAMVDWYLQSMDIEATPQAILANKDKLYFFRLEATAEPTPPGMKVDLAWIWPAILVSIGTLSLLKKLTFRKKA